MRKHISLACFIFMIMCLKMVIRHTHISLSVIIKPRLYSFVPLMNRTMCNENKNDFVLHSIWSDLTQLLCFLWCFSYRWIFIKSKQVVTDFTAHWRPNFLIFTQKNYIKDFTRCQFQMFSFFGSKHQAFFHVPRNLCVTSNEKFKSQQYLQNGFRLHHSKPWTWKILENAYSNTNSYCSALLCFVWLAITSHSCKLLQNERELVGIGCGKAWQNRPHFGQSGETYI